MLFLKLPLFHLIIMLFMLVSIATPFLQSAHARHTRALLVGTLFFTILGFGLYLFFLGLHASSDHLEVVLLRSYACSSALCSLVDELLSLRDEETPTRFLVLVFLVALFLLLLGYLIGGMSGRF